MITLIKTTEPQATVELPPDMFWEDEFAWSKVAAHQEYGTKGALFVDVSEKLAGQPITLTSEDDTCWLLRSVVDELKALADLPGEELVLSIYGVEFTVIFAPGEKPFDAEPIWREMPVEATDTYQLTAVRLITV